MSPMPLAVVVLALLAVGRAEAQEPQEPAQSAPGAASEDESIDPERRAAPSVEEIRVTGARIEATDIQDEAQAVTAFSMEQLDRANIVNVENLAFNVPGLHVGRQGNRVIVTLRAIGTENASVTGEPGVAYMVDGVNYARPSAAQVAFFDLEGVRVQRGPQGVLGGKNTTAGWIHVVTRKPHDEFEIRGDVQVGDYDQLRYRAALNVPISESLQARFATLYETRDGYQENLLFDSDDRNAFDADDWGLRQHLRFTPSDSLEMLFTYNYYRQQGNGTQVKLLGLEPRNPCPAFPFPGDNQTIGGDLINRRSRIPAPLACFVRIGEDPANPFRRRVDPADESAILEPDKILADHPSKRSNRFWGLTQTTEWDPPPLPWLGETRLKGLLSFQETDVSGLQDFDAASIPKNILYLADFSRQHSAELQWSNSAGERVDWQASLWFMRETSDTNLSLPVYEGTTPEGVDRFDPIQGVQSTVHKSYAGALHADVHLNDAWTLSLGLRYTKDKRSIRVLRETVELGTSVALMHCQGGERDTFEDFIPDSGPRFVPGVGIVADPVPVPSCSRTFRHATGGMGLEWRPGDEHLLYARADRGYKTGGFATLGFGGYEPEYIWAYALGNKSTFFDARLTVNAEAFYYDYSGLQLVVLDGTRIRTDNGDARIYGFDFEVLASPTEGLRLSAQVGYLNSEFTDYFAIDPTESDKSRLAELCGVAPLTLRQQIGCPIPLDDYSGNVLSRAPEWSLTLAAEYSFDLGSWGSLTPRVQYYWQDDTYYRAFNKPLDLQESYHLTDLRLTWTDPEERFSAELFVNNLEDDLIYQNVLVGTRAVASPYFAWYGPPRLWGLRLGYRY